MHLFRSLVLLLILCCACGNPQTINLAPQPTKKVVANIPDWFLEQKTDSDQISAVATATSRSMQVAMEKAKATAMTELAQQLGTRMANLTRQFNEEIGEADDSQLLQQFSSATKAVSDEMLVGAHVDRKEFVAEETIYRVYLRMSLPLGSANRLLLEKTRVHEELHTRLRSSQAFAELERQLESLAEGEAR